MSDEELHGQPVLNTDRELYREDTGDSAGSYYENSVHVTQSGGIGMNVGGTVIVQPIAGWHRDALAARGITGFGPDGPRYATPANGTREPTGGQDPEGRAGELLFGHRWRDTPLSPADERRLTAVAALIADADNWRRVTTGDPTEPEPLAMQARTLLIRNRELEATVARVRKLIDSLADSYNLGHKPYADLFRRALDGEPQP